MPNNYSIGSVLQLPDELLKAMNKADTALQKIQKSAKTTAQVTLEAFNKMANGAGLRNLQLNVNNIAANIDKIGEAAKRAAGDINSIGGGGGISNVGTQASASAESITNLTTAIEGMSAAFDGKTLTQWAVQMGDMYAKTKELTEEAKKLNEETRALASGRGSSKSGKTETVVSYDSAMNYAASVKSIYEATEAIKQLKLARSSLLVTDNEYAEKCLKINNEIERLTQQNKDFSMSENELAARLQKEATQAEKAAQAQEKRAAQIEKAAEAERKAQEYVENTTYQGSLDYANDATTINERAKAVKYLTEARNNLSTTDAQYKKKLEALNEAIKKMNDENEKAVEGSKELRKQHQGLMNTSGQLARAFALMFSVSQIRGYIKQVAEVRGEFEMAQRSLQALLGNKAEADQIFNKTVSLAVQSPYKIKDLIQYTRQLAAYRIENSKLYDTTKRLADVSAGLGVDMQRIILAYGQVKAAAFLKGTEVRQFTEAGVNIYSELQEYFEEVKGEAYTTAKIVDMISKKKVTFEDVEAIFQRMTDKGGMFYNMQLIQSETLQGKIMKLQDSIDIALNEIGKQSESLMKWFLDSITAMLGQWQALLTILTSVGSAAMLMSVRVAAASKRIQAAFAVIKASLPAASIIAALTTAITLFAEYYMAQVNAQVEEKKINDTYMERISILRTLEKRLGKTNDSKQRQESAKAVNESSQAVKESADAVDTETRAIEKNTQALVGNAEKRAAMQKFLGDAKKQMYVPAIDLSVVSDKDLDKAIEAEKERYDDYVRYMWLLEKAVNKNKASSWMFWEDDIVKDAQQYNEAAAAYINGAASVDMAAKFLEEAVRLMTDEGAAQELQKSLDILNSPQAEGETKFEHAKKRTDELVKVYRNVNTFIKAGGEELRSNMEAASKEISSYMAKLLTHKGDLKLDKTANEFASEVMETVIPVIDQVYAKIKDKSREEQEALLKMFADSIAMTYNMGEYALENLYATFNELYGTDIRPTKDAGDLSNGEPTAVAGKDRTKDRIRLLDEMNKRYETYRDIMSEAGAKAKVLEYYAESLAHVGMPQSVVDVLNAMGPSDEGTIKAFEELQKSIEDFDDLGDVKDKIATLKLEIDNEGLEEELNRAKTAVEEAFSGMELYKTLLSAGLGEADIRTMFKGIATSYGDVEKAIEKNLAGRQGKKWEDEYTEQKKRLEEQRSEQSVKEFTELVKEYKNAMSTRLQIDRWYWDENRKMRSNSTYLNARPELQAEMQSNLDSTYRQKIDDATWEEFRNSDYYTRIFDDLEGTSTRMLNSMSERLKSLKDSLQNLSPAQVEKVNKALSDINAMQAERNPFKYLKGGLTEYIKLLKERRDLEKSIAEQNESLNSYEDAIRKQSDIVNEAKEKWDDVVAKSGEESKEAQEAKDLYEMLYKILKGMVTQHDEIKEQIDDENKELDKTTEKSENMKTALSGIGKFLGDASASITAAFDALSDWGINIEMPDWLSEVAGGFSAIDDAISEIVSGKVVSGTFSLLGGIGKTLGGIFGWGTKDNKLSKQIEKLQDQVDSLAKAFEKLEEAMTSALSSTDIIENYESGIANLKSQIADYEEMIELEEDKKDTDEDAIEEYQDAIEELQEELEDYYNSYLEMLGGLSTDEYRSAAEEFAEAWIDAFNETEDTFEALTDNLQDYLDNMLKQMVTNAASEQFLQPIFDNLNAMVEEAGDITGLSKEALDEWISDSEDYLEQYNEFLEYYFEKLGITASGSSDSSLSALQQGIQSITEETGAALESLLNSMRFYLATQQADVAVIKTTLLAMASGSGYTESSSTPMLTELKAQTALLESIDARLASVIRAGHPKGGKALKIFMD